MKDFCKHIDLALDKRWLGWLSVGHAGQRFFLTIITNSLKKSFSCSGGISSSFLTSFFSFKNAIKMAMSLRVFDGVFLSSNAGNRKLEVSAISKG